MKIILINAGFALKTGYRNAIFSELRKFADLVFEWIIRVTD